MIKGTTRQVEFSPAFDRRNADPKKNYGVHGVDMRFILTGPKGAITWVVFTNWRLPTGGARKYGNHLTREPMPASVDMHSRVRTQKHQYPHEGCQYLDGATCYGDGSVLMAQAIFDALVEKGDKGAWAMIEDYYRWWILEETEE